MASSQDEDRGPQLGAAAGNTLDPCSGVPAAHPGVLGAQLGAEVQALLAVGHAGGELTAEREPAPPGPAARAMAIAAFSSAGRAKKARAAASTRSASAGSTPWPTT